MTLAYRPLRRAGLLFLAVVFALPGFAAERARLEVNNYVIDVDLMPQTHRDMYSYCNSVMEPWDGPAALALTDGRWVMAAMDRNGLRPMRYAVTGDGLIVAGSEAGMVRLNEQEVVEKGRLGPGQMIGVDLVAGRLYRDREIKDLFAARRDYSEWVKNITVIDSIVKSRAETVELGRDGLAHGGVIDDRQELGEPAGRADDAVARIPLEARQVPEVLP